jgi:hypothetical protein
MIHRTEPAAAHRPHWNRWLLGVYLATIAAVSIPKGFGDPDNNFAIFRAAFGNLSAGRDLYAPHPGQYLDLFKYSPTFAVLFAPFSALPLPLSILAWSALNALLLFYAVRRLLPGRAGTLALALLYLEVLRNMQRAQSNSLIAALAILAFLALERRRQFGAALAIALGAIIKIFPLAALALAALYPRRARFAFRFALVLGALLALPLLVVPPHELLAQYQSWRRIVSSDESLMVAVGGAGPYGGVMEQVRTLFGLHVENWPVQLAGTVLLLLPLALRRTRFEQREFRLLFLCSLLVYMVIFNFRSESPSFVIAVTGIVIWFVATPRTWLSTALMVLTIVIVSLSSTEITPHWLQRDVFVRFHLKTIPCVLAWLVMQMQLLRAGPARRQEVESANAESADVPRLRARPARVPVKWLAPPTAVVLVVLLAFYTNARDRATAEGIAAREVPNHLESGERVLQRVPASQRHWYDFYRGTYGVLAATTQHVIFVGVVPELYPSESSPRVFDVALVPYDSAFAIQAGGVALDRHVTVTGATGSRRFAVRATRRDTALFALVSTAQRRDSLILLAQLREKQFYDSVAALPPVREYYRVRRGDAIDLIARRYSTTSARLRELNHLPGDRIVAGDDLLISETRPPTPPCPATICGVLEANGGEVVP